MVELVSAEASMRTTALVLAVLLSVCDAFLKHRAFIRPMLLSVTKKDRLYKTELVDKISTMTDLPKRDVGQVLDALMEVLKIDVLKYGKEGEIEACSSVP